MQSKLQKNYGTYNAREWLKPINQSNYTREEFETSETYEVSIFVPSEFQIKQDTRSEQFENTNSRVELRTRK